MTDTRVGMIIFCCSGLISYPGTIFHSFDPDLVFSSSFLVAGVTDFSVCSDLLVFSVFQDLFKFSGLLLVPFLLLREDCTIYPGWPQTCSLSASASFMLGLQVCTCT